MRARVAISALLAAGLLIPRSGLASDHVPPRTLLRSGATAQPGQQSTYCWTTRDGPFYVTKCADYSWDFPPAEPAAAGRAAFIRIFKSQRPRRLDLLSWRRVNAREEPVGEGRDVAYRLRPNEVAGRQAWDAVFRLPASGGHYYLYAFGVWRDEEGAGDTQDSSWTYHLRLVDRA